jgi:hypothetical protein
MNDSEDASRNLAFTLTIVNLFKLGFDRSKMFLSLKYGREYPSTLPRRVSVSHFVLLFAESINGWNINEDLNYPLRELWVPALHQDFQSFLRQFGEAPSIR